MRDPSLGFILERKQGAQLDPYWRDMLTKNYKARMLKNAYLISRQNERPKLPRQKDDTRQREIDGHNDCRRNDGRMRRADRILSKHLGSSEASPSSKSEAMVPLTSE